MSEIDNIFKEKIRELSIQKKLENKRIFLFGYNVYTERISKYLYEEGYTIYAILDNDKDKQGKRVCNIPVCVPESIEWKTYSAVVLIASTHRESMAEQIYRLSPETEIFSLVELVQYHEQCEEKEKFWLEENFETELEKLNLGIRIYEKIKQEESLLVLPFPSIGDAFLISLYFGEYKASMPYEICIVTGSRGAYEVMQMFGIKTIQVSEQEQEALYKFVCFWGSECKNIASCGWTFILEVMARYKKLSFSQFIKKYVFCIRDDYQISFPEIGDIKSDDRTLIEMGLKKGKTVILAPYANSAEELPDQFWECLTEKLLEKNYNVVTNIAGTQKPVKKSIGLEIPLKQLGNYLEYAGFFIAIRSGLCDIAGHSQCRQMVIFREKYIAPDSSWIEYYDLHSEKISESSFQYVFDDNDFYKNIDVAIRFVEKTEIL